MARILRVSAVRFLCMKIERHRAEWCDFLWTVGTTLKSKQRNVCRFGNIIKEVYVLDWNVMI